MRNVLEYEETLKHLLWHLCRRELLRLPRRLVRLSYRLCVTVLRLLLEPPVMWKYCDKLRRYEPHNPRNEPPNAPPPRIF